MLDQKAKLMSEQETIITVQWDSHVDSGTTWCKTYWCPRSFSDMAPTIPPTPTEPPLFIAYSLDTFLASHVQVIIVIMFSVVLGRGLYAASTYKLSKLASFPSSWCSTSAMEIVCTNWEPQHFRWHEQNTDWRYIAAIRQRTWPVVCAGLVALLCCAHREYNQFLR